ncbi:MAG TPA: DUF2007 domain-containing protein [Candidatus Acidoferrales bacterium]|nr:DUF2007 domain-containing protein [Candidatus Acidoferrales bacterium]
MHDVKLVLVKAFGNREEAELAKGALESAGIDAMTQSDTAGRMREHLAWSGAGFQVWVREEDAAAAREILAAADSPASDQPADEDGDSPHKWRKFT